jgi:hypothetical protein
MHAHQHAATGKPERRRKTENPYSTLLSRTLHVSSVSAQGDCMKFLAIDSLRPSALSGEDNFLRYAQDLDVHAVVLRFSLGGMYDSARTLVAVSDDNVSLVA